MWCNAAVKPPQTVGLELLVLPERSEGRTLRVRGAALFAASLTKRLCTPGMGVNLWGDVCVQRTGRKSPVREPKGVHDYENATKSTSRRQWRLRSINAMPLIWLYYK